MRNKKHKNIEKKYGKKLYAVWSGMISRCSNPRNSFYSSYGGRGIFVCDEWKTFDVFYEDMIDDYEEGLHIDRINNNDGYFKENCRWVNRFESMNNTRSNRIIVFNGISKTLSQWANHLGIRRKHLERRLNEYKWPVEKALSGVSPVIKKRIITLNGEEHTAKEWSEILNIKLGTITSRLSKGIPINAKVRG